MVENRRKNSSNSGDASQLCPDIFLTSFCEGEECITRIHDSKSTSDRQQRYAEKRTMSEVGGGSTCSVIQLDDDDLNRLLFGDQLTQCLGGALGQVNNCGPSSKNLLTIGAASTADNMLLSSSICLGEELSWCNNALAPTGPSVAQSNNSSSSGHPNQAINN